MSAAPLDPLVQLEAAVAERAADRYADIALWQGIAGALREIRDGVIAGGRPILTTAEACQLVNVVMSDPKDNANPSSGPSEKL